ncbi:TVP38/TMEM64 family protein [Marinivivus vitaminiproducens]|uniref:TVP38/TMEM64 family protein n=1 Tax=Marinivivus vitaminiproducens TaxID=3035935 RepID=UPI00279AC8BE|nr:VTT domain-containing protein [Geminicoccaceae bacterium SCSIO 64248]
MNGITGTRFDMRTLRRRGLLAAGGAVVLGVAAGMGVLAWRHGLPDLGDLQAAVAADPVGAALAFGLAYATVSALAIPGVLVLTTTAGAVFGWWLGGAISVVAYTTGAIVPFLAARTGLSGPLRRRAGPWLPRVERAFAGGAFRALLGLRMAAVLPGFVLAVAPALLGVPVRVYLPATFLGVLPASFLYAALGAGVGSLFGARPEAILGGAVAAGLVLGGFALVGMVRAWRRTSGA